MCVLSMFCVMLPANQEQTPAKPSRTVTEMDGQWSTILSFRELDKYKDRLKNIQLQVFTTVINLFLFIDGHHPDIQEY